MIRYRCPHCALLTAAHERRVGQTSVCKACVTAHQIPTDPSLWLTEAGDPLHPAAPEPGARTAVEPTEASVEPPTAVEERSTRTDSVAQASQPVTAGTGEPQTDKPVASGDWQSDSPPRESEPELPAEPDVPSRAPKPEPIPPVEQFPAVEVADHFAREPEPEPLSARVDSSLVATEARPSARSWADVPSWDAPAPRAVAMATPPPQPAPVALARAPAVTPSADTPPPRYAEPVQLQTQADIAAALTAALATRMKPPPAPRRDLRPSTAIWMLLTGLGAALVLMALFTDLDYRWAAAAVGGAEVVLGYLWIVRLTHLRDPRRGLLCAVPPVTLFYLTQSKYAKLRPLRFVLTGAALAALAAAAPALADLARPLVRRAEPKPPPPDVATLSKLEQLRAYRERREYGPLVKLLTVLVKTDPLRSADAPDRAEIAAELDALCKHEDRAVRLEAMAALVTWDVDPNAGRARAVCLDALRSPSEDERMRALRLLPRWKDADAARAVQALIGRPGIQTNQARVSLEEIGGPAAEQAALALLKRADGQSVQLLAIEVLRKVGGPSAADELGRYAMATDDPAVRSSAQVAAATIRERAARPAP